MKFVPRAARKTGIAGGADPQLQKLHSVTSDDTAVVMGPQAAKSLVQLNAEEALAAGGSVGSLSGSYGGGSLLHDGPWAATVMAAARELNALSSTAFGSGAHATGVDIGSEVTAALLTHRFVVLSTFAETRRSVAAASCDALTASGHNVLVLVASRDVQEALGRYMGPRDSKSGRCAILTTGDFAQLASTRDDNGDPMPSGTHPLAAFDTVVLLDAHQLKLREFLGVWAERPCERLLALGEVDRTTRANLQQLSPKFALLTSKEALTARWSNVVHQVLFVPPSLRQLALMGAIQRAVPPVVVAVNNKSEVDEVTLMLRNADIEVGSRGVMILLPWSPRRFVPTRHVINYSLPMSAVTCGLSDRVDWFGEGRLTQVCFMTTFVVAENVAHRQELAQLLEASHQHVPPFLVVE